MLFGTRRRRFQEIFVAFSVVWCAILSGLHACSARLRQQRQRASGRARPGESQPLQDAYGRSGAPARRTLPSAPPRTLQRATPVLRWRLNATLRHGAGKTGKVQEKRAKFDPDLASIPASSAEQRAVRRASMMVVG